MNRIATRLAAVLLFFIASTVFAQSRFDITSFSPPAGWKPEKAADHVTFTHIDNAAGNFCMLGLYASRPGSGDAPGDFAGEWKSIVQQSFTAGDAPQTAARSTAGGLRYLEGEAIVQSGAASMLARLMVFPAGDRVASLLIVATDSAALASRQQAVRSFLGSLRLAGTVAAAASAAPAPVTAQGSAAAARSGITGVWMGLRSTWTTTRRSTPEPRWYVFFDDGQVFRDLPREGLANFDRAASRKDPDQNRYWSGYRMNGASGEIATPGVKFVERLNADKPGQMMVDSDRFYRSAAVDGLRLEGAWTSYGDPADPARLQRPVGERPIFRFTREGKFVDEGVFATFLRGYDGSGDSAGSGNYEIREYTLTLRYADGHVRRLALTGTLGADPAAQNDVIYLGRSRFNRLK